MPSLAKIGRAFTHIGMEIPIFLYMLAAFLKYPVFQNLIYEKVCLDHYHDDVLCQNTTAYYEDRIIQRDANHFYFISSVTLIVPSIIVSLFLGSAMDIWSTKIPLIIPFIGLIIGSLSYIIQTVYMDWNVYILLFSDAVFGVCGGFNAIIATTMAYGVKTTPYKHRGIRIAAMEGSIGLGGTIGYALSGTVRESVGYAWSFVIQLVLQVFAFLYVIFLAKELYKSNENTDTMRASTDSANELGICTRLFVHIIQILQDFIIVLKKQRMYRSLLNLNLLGLGLELLIFAGLSDIQYSFLRYKLGWGDKEYGWFSGMAYAITTVAVLTVYPLLRLKGVTDSLLGSGGIFMKIISLIVLAFVSTPVMAYCVTVLTIGNRFVSTGLRSFLITLVDEHEQGRVFSMIALMEGVTNLLATAIYNNLYPKTLSIFPGMMILISAGLLVPCLVILFWSDIVVRRLSVSPPGEIHEEQVSAQHPTTTDRRATATGTSEDLSF